MTSLPLTNILDDFVCHLADEHRRNARIVDVVIKHSYIFEMNINYAILYG